MYNLYARNVDGATQDVRLTTGANTQLPDSLTPDGAFVIGHEVRPQTKSDLVRIPLNQERGAGGSAAEVLVEAPFDDWSGEISPDGRFLAYQSDESGQSEIYVRPYPLVVNARWQVSSGGGGQPVWTRGGRELVYLDGARHLTAVPVDPAGATFRAGTPVTLVTTDVLRRIPLASIRCVARRTAISDDQGRRDQTAGRLSDEFCRGAELVRGTQTPCASEVRRASLSL